MEIIGTIKIHPFVNVQIYYEGSMNLYHMAKPINQTNSSVYGIYSALHTMLECSLVS